MKKLISMVLVLSLILTMGCQKQSDQEISKESYRDQLTPEEIQQGTATFDMGEKLSVDATLTPQKEYEAGLNSYDSQIVYEGKAGTEDSFKKKMTLFGSDQKQLNDCLNEWQKGTLQKMTVDIPEKMFEMIGTGTFHTDAGKTYTLSMLWEHNYPYYPEKSVVLPQLSIYPEEQELDIRHQMYGESGKKPAAKQETDDEKKQAAEYKAWLEKLMGRKLADRYRVMDTEPDGSGNRYTVYEYYHDVDGFPLVQSSLSYRMKEGETADEEAQSGGTGGIQLDTLYEPAQQIMTDQDGICAVSCYSFYEKGKIYKKDQTVISPDEILKKMKAYYERMVQLDKKTIREIELVYTLYFSDGNEGKIRLVMTPVWRVVVQDEGEDANLVFWYDAFNGECYGENTNEQ